MGAEELISVIIPTRNRKKYLERAINSVLNQTYKNLELIIVDDNSSDNTEEVVKEFIKKDNRIKYIRKTRRPNNPAASRNDGIKVTIGKYIAFLDDDDEWIETKLEEQVKVLKENSSITFVYTKYSVIKKGKTIKASNKISTPTVIVRKNTLDKVGLFDENLDCAEDRDMWKRLRGNGASYFLDKNLVAVHLHESQQISDDLEKKIRSEKYYFKKWQDKLRKENKLYINYFNLGSLYLKNGDYDNSKKYLKESIREKCKIRTIVYIIFLYIFPSLFRILLIDKNRRSWK